MKRSAVLAGRTVAVLESRAGAELGRLVERLGGTPLRAPAVAELPDVDRAALARFLRGARTEPPALFVFQTGAGTRALLAATAAGSAGCEWRALLEAALVAVRGPKPMAVLRAARIRIDRRAAPPYTTVELLAAIDDLALAGRTVAVQRHGEANAALEAGLAARGARVQELASYRWALPADRAPLAALLAALAAGAVDLVVFTSAVQLRHLLRFAREQGCEAATRRALARLPLVSIGPACSAALQAERLPVAATAEPPKLGGLPEALERAVCRREA